MRKVAAIFFSLLLNFTVFAGALPSGGAPAAAPTPLTLEPAPGEGPALLATEGAALPRGELKGPLPDVARPQAPAPPRKTYQLGIEVPYASPSYFSYQQSWWYAGSLAPQPLSVIVGSNTTIILFARDGGGMTQVPTDADIAAGAKPIGFANNTTTAFFFSGKLFETTVGNRSINASNDMDLGIANQTLQLFFDGVPLDVGAPVITGNETSPIPQPFRFSNGTFSFFIPRLPDYGCGAHVFRIVFDNQTAGNNFTYYASSARDFRVYTTCETTLAINVDQNPIVVGQYATFYGALTGSKAEAVPGRPIQILMDGRLLGQTGPGVFIDNVEVEGTTFNDNFEDLNTSNWDQSGAGVGTWSVGRVEIPDGPPPVEPGSVNLAGTGLTGWYGKGVDTWFVSPPIDLTSPSVPAVQLRFFFWYNISFDDNFEVAFSTDAGASWLNLTQLSASASSGNVVSLPDAFGRPQWDQKGINLSYFIGAPALLIGFHFKSVDHTTVTSGSGGYAFRFQMPLDTTAATHIITAQFKHGIPFDASDGVTVATDPAWDLAYQSTTSKEQIRLDVKRQSHFVFNLTEAERIGFRGSALTVAGKLLDNMDEPLLPDPINQLDRILVHIEWDPDYNDPFDVPVVLKDKEEVESTGGFDINYVVTIAQPLGLHNVTFSFAGSKFYTNSTGLDVYRLMGHTYVTWPPESERWVYRFREAKVTGEIHVLPAESRFNRQVGDAVDGELVRITWTEAGNVTEIPEGQVGVLTNGTGGFLATKFVGFGDELGKKPVALSYSGSDIYTAVVSNTNWSVVSEVQIVFDETSVYKGSILWLNGSMLDDRGVGVDKQTVQIFLDFEQVAVTTTSSDGSFAVPHAIATDMTVGNKQVLLRFNGNPIYRANETVTNVTVKAHTQILRTDHTQVIDRGKQLNVTAEIFEVYEGGIRGSPVGQEGVAIRIQDRRLTVQVSNSEGKLQFRSAVPADLPWGEAVLAFEYNGSDFYDAASNETPVVVRGVAVVTFLASSFTLNGAPFNLSSDVIHQKEELAGLARVTDELGVPLASGDFRLFYTVQSGAGVLAERRFVSAGPIDELGRYEFNVTWDDFSPGNRTLLGVFNGSFCPTFISPRTLCLRPAEGNISVRYEYLPPPEREPNNTVLYLVLASVGIILGSAFYFFWYAAKRRQLQKMQRIIRRAADRLVAGNPYAQVIFDAYRALARFLQANGYLRRDSETFRQFEEALRQALPIDAKSMDEFLSILEEARYSDHEIGEAQKDRALASLNAVKSSIEQVLLSGGGAIAPPPPAPPPPQAAPPPAAPPQPGAPPPT